ncbi:MAG: hypothetical protein SGI88_00830 [Candidatus Hydrogenedentes bacterium]|nr:hypothetical protein [Candidatus Hydrogenedentota bacterium]
MTAFALLFLVVAAPVVQVTIAPDQPAPFVYADDPVILQITSDSDGTAAGQVTIAGDNGANVAVALTDLPLRANGPHWQTLDTAPKELGRYRAHVVLNVGGDRFEANLVYCRIARPNGEITSPVRVAIQSDNPVLLHALRGVPLQRVTIDASSPALAAITGAGPGNGFRFTVNAPVAVANDAATVGPLVASAKDKIEYWRFTLPEEKMPGLESAIAAIRQAGVRSPVEIVLPEDADVPDLLANGLGRAASAIVLHASEFAASEIDGLHTFAERAGYESLPMTVSHAAELNRTSSELMHEMLGGMGPRMACEVTAEDLFAKGAFTETYPMLSAVAHRFNGHAFADDYGDASNVRGKIFRAGNDWVVALWTAKAPVEHVLLTGDAKNLQVFDAWNNPVPAPSIQNGAARVMVTARPTYVRGTGGGVLAFAARISARREAESFVKDRWLQQDLPKEIQDILKPVGAASFVRTDRVSFFALLRMFPVLEQKWHDGSIRRDVAVPAMASLSRLARSLCVLEQASGEPFIELLQETLARCGEYQSQYLTSTGGTEMKHERAEWLAAEVARLTAEARTLADAGLGIEAVGIASLAEWRARSLEFALNAEPLGIAEPPRAAPVMKPKPSAKKQPTTRKR